MSVADYFNSMDYGPAPEDDGAARAWLEQHATGFGHFIGGAFRAPWPVSNSTRWNPRPGA
jgi:aldehyde dehydrogenase (NAD+)